MKTAVLSVRICFQPVRKLKYFALILLLSACASNQTCPDVTQEPVSTCRANLECNPQSTGGKVLSTIGMILSGAGSGLSHQPNQVVENRNQCIENNLAAQKANSSKRGSASQDVVDLWFYVIPLNRGPTENDRRQQSIIVRPDHKFGFDSTFPQRDELIAIRVELEVPSSPQNFGCPTCAAGEMFITEDQKHVVVEKFINGNRGRFGFSWRIDRHDPKGKYLMRISIAGQNVGEHEFTVR